MKKPSYRKLKQMLTDAETAFRQVQSNNLNQGSELVQLRETIKKLSNDLEHKDRSLREAYERACRREADHKEEILRWDGKLSELRTKLFIADSKAAQFEARVKQFETKLEAVRLVIR